MSKVMHSRRSKGFTLIELMIVILIIAILVGIAIPVYLAARRNAQKRTCQANLRTIEGSINTYMADAELYPDDILDMESGIYQVLKKAYECPTDGTVYSLSLVAGGSMPTVSCPSASDPSGHEI